MPATNGSRMSWSNHSTAASTRNVRSQNVSWRPESIGSSPHAPLTGGKPGGSGTHFCRVHVAHPLGDIEGNGKQGQGRDQCGEHHHGYARIEIESTRGHDYASERNLRNGVELGDEKR